MQIIDFHLINLKYFIAWKIFSLHTPTLSIPEHAITKPPKLEIAAPLQNQSVVCGDRWVFSCWVSISSTSWLKNLSKFHLLLLTIDFLAGPPKPSIPKVMLEYVDSDAMDWLTNLVDIDWAAPNQTKTEQQLRPRLSCIKDILCSEATRMCPSWINLECEINTLETFITDSILPN